MLDFLKQNDPEIAEQIMRELARQNEKIELIASENLVSPTVMEAQGSVLTNKYAEGYPGNRYHAGCEHVDVIESIAIERARQLFGAQHANVQPHSGVNANLAVYVAMLKPGDTILGMQLDMGGHLSHGSKANISGKFYSCHFYGVDRESELIDYGAMQQLARDYKPRMIVAGASSYSRVIDYAPFREVADEIGALFLVDMAHISGIVAAGQHPNPVPYADFVTTTTTKTIRGARGGLILCRQEYGRKIDKAIFPGIQGGPQLQTIAGKAVCFREAMSGDFKSYIGRVLKNARAMAAALEQRGYRIVAGGTDTHLFLVDLRSRGLTGASAEEALDAVGITVNKNMIPFDPEKPQTTSGIRIGTSAMTTRGLDEAGMLQIAELIDKTLSGIGNPAVQTEVRRQVREICREYPIYGYTFKQEVADE
ncbi:MAG: serine hydroxymethyltransferase [Spirochaetaceae bacterium]|nr:MAG: serine hydroxymethyltransferase [Spirochaetaceae bacterium]